jgi:hypothetical protein
MRDDPKWSKRFETAEQLIEVVKAYCKERNLGIGKVREGNMDMILFSSK